MNNQMIVLASRFMDEIKDFKKDAHGKINCDSNYKKEVINDIGEILAGESVTAKQFHELFDKEKDNPQKGLFYKPSSILDAHNIQYVRKPYRDPDNLLVPGQFYFHPRLQLTPPPPMLKISDDGTIEASYDDEPFYLEIVDKITKKDLVDYFYSKTNAPTPEATLSRDIGAFDHMLRFWDVDFIFYLIDEAFTCSLDNGKPMPKSPLDIQHFEAEALLVHEARKNTCYEEGLDRVLPRAIS
ncbi:hypothetical protein ACQVWE_14000 [Bacillus cereus]|uniref:hypothetical protein n=1 Tax=Bacillus cereus TaxID=1396 RepID=UPI00211D8EFB|nr:hypothetical protein [Bacillus cereus]